MNRREADEEIQMNRAVRLQKFIADCGITSRRKAEALILQGRVKVNDRLITEMGTKIDPETDAIFVDGQAIDNKVEKLYIVLHKPRGFMTTLSDPEGRKTVMDLVKEFNERIYPVGRLDYLSEGLLILTNDGEFANTVIHPSTNIEKTYEVKVFGSVTHEHLKKMRDGVQTTEGFLKPKSVRVIKQLPTKTWLEFRITDGKNREIRRICEGSGLTVDKLKRIAIGGLPITGIAPGSYIISTKKELLKLIGIDENGQAVHSAKEYFSLKKTVNVARKGAQNGTSADDSTFHKFRKDSYYDSLKAIKETKKDARRKIYEEEIKAKEDAHQARKLKKAKRVAKKEAAKKHGHVQIM